MTYLEERKELAYFMQRLYAQGLTTCSGGNISFKINEHTILITPSQLDKARLKTEQIGIITIEGENLTPELKLSMETQMHLSIYKKRQDVKAVIHAHPVFATSFAVSGKKININLTGEARAIVGIPVWTPYALMGSKKLAAVVSDGTLKGNAIIMENHGVLTVGETLLQAFDRLEILEYSAKITLITDFIGSKKEISSEELNKIDKLFSIKP